MNENKATEQRERPPGWQESVELVGGPLCGKTVQWPGGEKTAAYAYYGGTATYAYEGKGKATYENA